MVRCTTNVLYHSLDKTGKEPNADLFQFMKGPSHQRTEEEIKFVFKNLGWDYSPIPPPCNITFSEYLHLPEEQNVDIILGNHLFVFPMENYSGNHPFVFQWKITHTLYKV